MKTRTSRTAIWMATLLFGSTTLVYAGGHEKMTIGQVTALIAEASTADEPSELQDGKSGDTNFPFIGNMKAIATVGEVDKMTGKALTGYPDGQAAWLQDDDTVRVAYQSESYATMGKQTYGWQMKSGVAFTGSHIHWIDYNRNQFANFLNNSNAANTMVEGSGHLFHTIYNQFGEVVQPRAQGGTWGNQTLPNGTVVDFNDDHKLTEGDFFFQSFCGAFYEPAHKYGKGIGLEDDVWITAEEWNIQQMFEGTGVDTNDTLGLASVVVDIANETAYTVPALGQSGYEKIMPINPGHSDYVLMVMAGYNHDVEPTPLRLYVGKKGVDANNQKVDQNGSASQRDKFLARNGLLYGKIYGMALENRDFAKLGIRKIDTSEKMLDNYLTNPHAPDRFQVKFVPTSYQWKGWDQPVSVGNTEINRWQMASEQPAGHTFFVGDSKTEHPAVDPDITKQRYVQNMTQEGGILGVELTDFVKQLEMANGDLPTLFSADVTRVVAAVEGALTLETGGKGIKHGGEGTAATWEDGQAKIVANDGLMWVKTVDADVLIVDEDSGNDLGERKFALMLDPETMDLTEAGKGYFLAMAGGGESPRAAAKAAAYPGTFAKPYSSEFSGTWNISALVARKSNGSFYSKAELAGTGQQEVNGSLSLSQTTLLGVVQHRSESGGAVEANKSDRGGQIFIFNLELPSESLMGSVESLEKAGQLTSR